RRSEDGDVGEDDDRHREPDEQVQLPERLREEVRARRDRHVRDALRTAKAGRPVRAVDDDEEVARDTEGEEVDRGAADDLVAPKAARLCPRTAAQMPQATARPPTSAGQTSAELSTGGSVNQNASAPRPTPTLAIALGLTSSPRAAGAAGSTARGRARPPRRRG